MREGNNIPGGIVFALLIVSIYVSLLFHYYEKRRLEDAAKIEKISSFAADCMVERWKRARLESER